jgi:hypothetical protein
MTEPQTLAAALPSLPANILPNVGWFLDHADVLPTLVADAQAIEAADGVQAKWDASKKFGDDVIGVLADFPGLGVPNAQETSVEHVQAMAAAHPAVGKFGDGHLIQLIITDGPAIIKLIQQILPLFIKP